VLKQVAVDASLPVLVEHFDERTADFMHASDRAEIRITGPFVYEFGPDSFRIDIDANVLLASRYDGQKKNAFDIHRFAGLFQEAMGSPIPVWNYGNQPGDYEDSDPTTQEFIGCLLPRSGKDQPVRVFHFGQNQATDKTKQTVVDARYTLYL
jgi:hypothetical protein